MLFAANIVAFLIYDFELYPAFVFNTPIWANL